VLLALDILASGDGALSPSAQELVTTSVHAHAEFIVANLEWTRTARTNHYLADICGLVWAAAHLEGSRAADSWLCFGARELQAETRGQFDRDGAGTEGSTSYHRLSAEMVTWTTAVLLGLPDDRLNNLHPNARDLADVPLPLRHALPVAADAVPGRNHLRLVSCMPHLTEALTHEGSISLIGDNDSGRFVKPAPAYRRMTAGEVVARYGNLDGYNSLDQRDEYWWEDTTDHGHVRRAIDGLFGVLGGDLDGALVRAYARRPVARPATVSSLCIRVGPAGAPTMRGGDATREIVVLPGGDDLLVGLDSRAFVTFGLYVWRSKRLFLAIRCGPIGQDGLGGHDHRDQLAIELWIDGVPWFRDPGSVTYTRDPELRNAYRSALAHVGPNAEQPEDWAAAPGLFALGSLASPGIPLWFTKFGFAGAQKGPDYTIARMVELLTDRVRITDAPTTRAHDGVVLRSAEDAARAFPPRVPFSPGYGWQERAPTASS